MKDVMKKLTILVATFALARTAAADPNPAAEKLFRDGKQLMKDGKVAEACSAFEASETSEHNIATVMNLADCREKNQQLASAWALYLRVDAESRMDPALARLGETARDRAASVETHLSYLVINVPDDSSVHGLIVSRDGVALDASAWNRAVPLDAGDHVVEAKAPGHEPWSTTVHLAVRDDHQAVEVPRFSDLPLLAAPAVTTPPAMTFPVVHRETGPSHAASFALGGTAVVAIGVGGALWLQGRGLHHQAIDACPDETCTFDEATHANELETSANHYALGGNIAIGIGVASAVASVILWRTSHEAHDVAIVPQLGDGAGLAVVGGF
jgi:hypothetical protein